MDNQSATHSAKTIARNITIGVVTPVLAATIIYFLGFNRGDSNADFKKKKDATVSVWTAFVQNKQILTAVFKQIDPNTPLDVARDNMYHEIDVTVANMDNIKKEPNADQRVYSCIDIITQQVKDMKPIVGDYAKTIIDYYAAKHSQEERDAFVAEKDAQLLIKMETLRTRDTIRVNAFYNGLNKDYGVVLPSPSN